MNDSDIINKIRQLLENAHYAGSSSGMREQYLSQAASLAHQISDASIKYQYLDMIEKARW